MSERPTTETCPQCGNSMSRLLLFKESAPAWRECPEVGGWANDCPTCGPVVIKAEPNNEGMDIYEGVDNRGHIYKIDPSGYCFFYEGLDNTWNEFIHDIRCFALEHCQELVAGRKAVVKRPPHPGDSQSEFDHWVYGHRAFPINLHLITHTYPGTHRVYEVTVWKT